MDGRTNDWTREEKGIAEKSRGRKGGQFEQNNGRRKLLKRYTHFMCPIYVHADIYPFYGTKLHVMSHVPYLLLRGLGLHPRRPQRASIREKALPFHLGVVKSFDLFISPRKALYFQ